MQGSFASLVFPNLPVLAPGPGLKAIVSGGQTGVDQGALDAALQTGFPCGGWCPEDRKCETGTIHVSYPVHPVEEGGYKTRTLRNLASADGTLIIYDGELEGGTLLTSSLCQSMRKPHLLINASELSTAQAARLAAQFICQFHINILNVAGPRHSKWPQAHTYTKALISALLSQIHS